MSVRVFHPCNWPRIRVFHPNSTAWNPGVSSWKIPPNRRGFVENTLRIPQKRSVSNTQGGRPHRLPEATRGRIFRAGKDNSRIEGAACGAIAGFEGQRTSTP